MPEKTLKDREKLFGESLRTFLGKYDKEMLKDFFYYWTEPNKSKTKMRFEMEKTWDIARRLRTFEKNQISWKKGSSAKPEPAGEKYWLRDPQVSNLKTLPPEPKLLTDEDLDNICRSDIEAFYQRCRSGIVPKAIPDYFKPILVKDGIMSEQEKLSDVMTKKLNSGIPALYAKTEA